MNVATATMGSSYTGQGGSASSLHSLISQLSFSSEIPDRPVAVNDDVAIWNGLFCLNFDEDADDLFFDAQEELVEFDDRAEQIHVEENETTTANLVLQLRGGGEASLPHTDSGPVVMQSPTQTPGGPSSASGQGQETNSPFYRLQAPSAPEELPDRFLRAGKGDPEEGRRRYEATLKWRAEHGIDTILTEAHPNFELIKDNYPHYFHLRGRNGEPVFFEQPPKTNLQAMRNGGVTLKGLLHHYAMVTEYQWQVIEKDDFARSITIFDLEGMRMMDFVGECVEYVRKCSEFTGQHYPERAGHVFVINVPGWFAMIWNVVKPMVDEVTLKKINILRGKEEIFKALLEKIPIENIPPEYGGQSMPLGQSPEEVALRSLMRHNMALAHGDHSCGGRAANPPCEHCSLQPIRRY